MTIPGGTLRGAHDITIANTTFTDTLHIVSTVPNANIVIDHDVFNNIEPVRVVPRGADDRHHRGLRGRRDRAA